MTTSSNRRNNFQGLKGQPIRVKRIEPTRQPESRIVREDRFRYLVENAFDVILECAVSGRILYVSPNVAEVLGYTPDEIIGTFLVDLLHPDDAQRGIEAFAAAVGDGDQIHATLRYRSRSVARTVIHDQHFTKLPLSARQIANHALQGDRQAFFFVVSGDYDRNGAGQSVRRSMLGDGLNYNNLFPPKGERICPLKMSC